MEVKSKLQQVTAAPGCYQPSLGLCWSLLVFTGLYWSLLGLFAGSGSLLTRSHLQVVPLEDEMI